MTVSLGSYENCKQNKILIDEFLDHRKEELIGRIRGLFLEYMIPPQSFLYSFCGDGLSHYEEHMNKIHELWGDGPGPQGLEWRYYAKNDIRSELVDQLVGNLANRKVLRSLEMPPKLQGDLLNASLDELIIKINMYINLQEFFNDFSNGSWHYSGSQCYKTKMKDMPKFNKELEEMMDCLFRERFFYLPSSEHREVLEEDLIIFNCLQILNRDFLLNDHFQGLYKEITGMNDLKLDLFFKILCPIFDPAFSEKYYQDPPNGVLFYGPPGCGKTHIAKALAKSMDAVFVDYSPGSHGSPFQNVTSQKIQEMFDEASARYRSSNKRTVIFVDEADSVFPRRDHLSAMSGGSKKDDVEQFLRNMESCNENGILVVCTTNFKDNLDQAILRSGRLDLKFELLSPSKATRKDLLKKSITRIPFVSHDVDIERLAIITERFPPSSIKAIVQQAASEASRSGGRITMAHLEHSIANESLELGIVEEDLEHSIANESLESGALAEGFEHSIANESLEMGASATQSLGMLARVKENFGRSSCVIQ